MILPDDFDLSRPDADLVDDLVATGAYDREEAAGIVELLRDGVILE